MDRKGEPVRQPISPACPNDRSQREAGFTLLEVVCVLAIFALLAAIALPALPRGTSRPRLESYAVAAAALLKADRNAALRRQTEIATEVDSRSRLIRSGATGRVVKMPDDIMVEALLSARCDQGSVGSTIKFFPSGTSCGGVVALSISSLGYEVRVNWLTGGVDVVPFNRG